MSVYTFLLSFINLTINYLVDYYYNYYYCFKCIFICVNILEETRQKQQKDLKNSTLHQCFTILVLVS